MLLADSDEAEFPSWFPFLELGGVVIVALSIAFLMYAMRGIGGKLGGTFRVLLLGLVVILMGLIWRAACEFQESEGFYAELVFEICLYAGLMVVMFACSRFAQLAR